MGIFAGMITLYVKEFLRSKGFPPKPHTLVKYGFNQYIAYQLINNKVKNLSLETLTKLCISFDCTPNDLFNFKAAPNTVPATSVVHRLTKQLQVESPIDYVKVLKPEEITVAYDFLKKMVENRNRQL